MSKENFDTILEQIMAIKLIDLIKPNMPISEAIQEGANLAIWAKSDEPQLQKAGLDITLIDSLPIRTGALRHQQGMWQSDTDTRKQALKAWKEQYPLGYELRTLLFHTCRFAFRDDPKLLKRVDEIAEDYGHADMIQDLYSLSLVAKDNLELIQKTGFDIAKLDEAAALSGSLGDLLSSNNENLKQSSKVKLLRDQCYTYMMKAIIEIRKHGKFVFWRTPDRLSGYSSDYFRD